MSLSKDQYMELLLKEQQEQIELEHEAREELLMDDHLSELMDILEGAR